MKTYLTCLSLTLSAVFNASAEVVEQWTFSEADGSGISETFSDQGMALTNMNKPSALVKDGKLKFVSSNAIDSIYLVHEFSNVDTDTGVYEASWTYTNAAFAATHEVKGKATVGFDIRDTGGTRYKGSDDRVLGGVRLAYEKTAFEVQYQDGTTPQFKKIAKIERIVLPEPLHVRLRYDLDRSGEPGSLQIFLRIEGEEEVQMLADGIIPRGVRLTGYRVQQQITNGGSDWQEGDYVCVDNFTLSKVD